MRMAGVTDVVVGLSPNGHLCWPFDDFAEFRARAAEFLVDGLEHGQRACYAALRATDGELRIDCTGPRFIDHNGPLSLISCARSHDATLVVQSGTSTLTRLASVLGLEDVRVESVR